MSGNRLGIQETAAYLRTLDDVLLLTHVRPDGDTIGSPWWSMASSMRGA